MEVVFFGLLTDVRPCCRCRSGCWLDISRLWALTQRGSERPHLLYRCLLMVASVTKAHTHTQPCVSGRCCWKECSKSLNGCSFHVWRTILLHPDSWVCLQCEIWNDGLFFTPFTLSLSLSFSLSLPFSLYIFLAPPLPLVQRHCVKCHENCMKCLRDSDRCTACNQGFR